MHTRSLKVSFRYKNGRPGTAVKATSTVRVPNRGTPLQLHLGYVPSGSAISDRDLDRLDAKLLSEWTLLYPGGVAVIDREDAKAKWKKVGEKRLPIDRTAAFQQMMRWFNRDFTIIAPFTGEYRAHDCDFMFNSFFFDSAKKIAPGRGDVDRESITEWWQNSEMPRLLYRFHDFTKRRPTIAFGPGGFIVFLKSNIATGYAFRSYIRTSAAEISRLYRVYAPEPSVDPVYPGE